jgi:hypothetical protein
MGDAEQSGPNPPRSTGARARAALLWGAGGILTFMVVTGGEQPGEAREADHPSLTVFELHDDAVAPLGPTLRPNQPLSLAYTNPAGSPFRYWFVGSRESDGAIRWLLPHPKAPAAALRMTAMFPDVRRRQLGRPVPGPATSGPVEFCALFFRERVAPATIRNAARVARGWPEGTPRSCVRTEVVAERPPDG